MTKEIPEKGSPGRAKALEQAREARRRADPVRWARYLAKKRESPSKTWMRWKVRKPRQDQTVLVLLQGARKRAREKGLPFNLEPKDIVIPERCPVLGLELKRAVGAKQGASNSPSIDRQDNSLGYTRGNVAVISQRANTLKNNATIEELRAVLAYMEENEF